jgi:hypothetical protein
MVPRQAARTRHNGLHQRQQVCAAHGRVCGRLRRHAAEAAWTREAAAGGSGRQRGGVRRARTDGVKGVRWARLRGLWWRHGRGVAWRVSGRHAHAQRAGAWRAGSMRQDMTDARVEYAAGHD